MKFFLEHYDGVLLMLGAGGITILVKTIVACIYTELLHQAQQLSTTKNKWLRNMISKYETTYKMNLKINDTKSFVFIQMKDVKYLGVNLYNLKNAGVYGAAVTAIIYAFYMVGGYFEKAAAQWYIKMSIIMGIVFFAICISELFLQLNRKDKLLRCEVYDYIENNLQPHLAKIITQTETTSNENEKQREAEDEAAVGRINRENMSEGGKEKRAVGKPNKNVYGHEELELFQEMMEGIYGEEI